jgi:hypothetical protein
VHLGLHGVRGHGRPPVGERYETWLDHRPLTEPRLDLGILTPADGTECPGHQFLALDGDGALLRQFVPREPEAGDGEVAAGRHRVAQFGHDPTRLALVLDVMQHREEQQANRLAEVDQ